MKEQRICYIFGAGERVAPVQIPSPEDFVIAADGGYAHLEALGIRTDLAVGDFDSLGAPPQGVPVLTLPKEKDDTDMAAAIREGLARGFRVFHLYGGTGGRMDHTLANLQCLADLARQGARGFLFDHVTVTTAISECCIRFPADAVGTVSVFAHSDVCSGVCEAGLQYPLDNATLRNTNPLGVSNAFTGVPSSISVGAGILMILYPRQVREEADPPQ